MASSLLARIWVMVFQKLDDQDCDTGKLECLRWMPAHGAQSSIGRVLKSDGKPVSPVEWRANRLVDLLAKSAVVPHRLPVSARILIDTAAEALEYSLAKLGAVTYAANNFLLSTVLGDGTTTVTTERDSVARRPCPNSTTQRSQKRIIAEVPHASSPPAVKKRRVTAYVKKQRMLDQESIDEICFWEYWQSNRSSFNSAPPGDARSRLAALRARVVARGTTTNSGTGE